MEEPEKIESPEAAEAKDTEKSEEKNKKEKQLPEVIARKAQGYFAALVFSLGFGVFMAFFGAIIVAVGIVKGGNVPMYLVGAVMFFGGIGLIVYSAISIKKIRSIPQVVISREGETVNFFVTKKVSFSCKVNEITNVSYYQAYGKGQTRPWGTLVVYFGEKELPLVYIKDVVAAHNRLFALMLESKKNEEKQEPEEAEKPDETKNKENIENGKKNGWYFRM